MRAIISTSSKMNTAPPNHPPVIGKRILQDLQFLPQQQQQVRVVEHTCSGLEADQRKGVFATLNEGGHQELVNAVIAMTAPSIPEACQEAEQRESD